MDQLVADEATAPGGDPVEDAADASETVVDQPEESTEGDMYPDDAPPEGEEGEGPADDDEDEPDEPDEPAIDPPHSWKAEDKERWGNIPREAQEVIARRETEVARIITQKSEEAATAKKSVVEQAGQEIAQFREQMASRYQQLAQQIMPQPPDQRLALSNDPQHHVLYNQQRAVWEQALVQQQKLQQASDHEAAEAQRIRDEQMTEARQADDAKLREVLPDWFSDGEEGRKLQGNLKSIALELGYSENLWEEKNSSDVLALKRAADWKRDALKWRSYQASKGNGRNGNGTFRASRQLPPVTKPGTSQSRGSMPLDPVKLLYPND